jgi:glycosyltransferase involved in cell wall biosynthesis
VAVEKGAAPDACRGTPLRRGPDLTLIYLCHDQIPSPETRTEQIVRSMSALARHGVSVTLAVPAGREPMTLPRRIEEIRTYYHLADPTFPAGLIALDTHGDPDSRRNRVLADVRGVSAARAGSWDVVYTRDPRAMVMALLHGLPTVFETYRTDLNELRRFWPLRRVCYTRPNLLGIVTHSRRSLESFRDAGIDAARLHLAYNGYDPASLLPERTRAESRRELGLPSEARLIVYAGYVSERKGTSFLLSIAALLGEATFLVVGAVPGSAGERLFRSEVERRGLHNVRMQPRVPPPAVPAFLYAADCLIVPPTDAPLRRYRRTVLPMKIFTYMAAGRPILAPDLPDVREILTDGRNARLVRPDAPREAAAALSQMLSDWRGSQRLAARAKADATAFTWESRAEGLAAFLRDRHAAWQTHQGRASGSAPLR